MKSTQKPSKLHFLFNPARPWPGILAALLLAGFVHQAAAQSYSLSTAWTAANGTGHLANNNANRGIAFSALSNIVFVSTRAGTATGSIDVFNAANGALLSGTGGVTGANLGIDQVGVGDDGILYGAPLSTTASSGSPFQLYSWTNWNNSPYLAYQSTNSADPLFTFSGTKRVGDTLAVTGAGTNTLIVASSDLSHYHPLRRWCRFPFRPPGGIFLESPFTRTIHFWFSPVRAHRAAMSISFPFPRTSPVRAR